HSFDPCLAPAPSEPHSLPLHDALPISAADERHRQRRPVPHRRPDSPERILYASVFCDWAGATRAGGVYRLRLRETPPARVAPARSEEHTSELQSLAYLVCRLLIEKKNY